MPGGEDGGEGGSEGGEGTEAGGDGGGLFGNVRDDVEQGTSYGHPKENSD